MTARILWIALAIACLPAMTFGKSAGFVNKGMAWTEDNTYFYTELPKGIGPTVTMCWESGASTYTSLNGKTYNFTEIRNFTKVVVKAQWERYAKIYFRWLESHNNNECNVKIHFTSNPDWLGLVTGGGGYLATDMYLNIDWMVPINEATWAPTTIGPRSNWNALSMQVKKLTQYGFLQETVLHEIGHVMAFAHEHLRTQEGRDEHGLVGEIGGDTEIGAYDAFSIMNYFRLQSTEYPNPMPRISCGDVASARFLYDGAALQHPNLAPNCTRDKLKIGGETENMTETQFTGWVGDPDLNTTAKTLGASNNPKVIQTNSLPGFPAGYWENITVNAVLNPSTPGYILTFGLKNVNFQGVSCSQPVKINRLTLFAVEESWNNRGGDQSPTDPDCSEMDDCTLFDIPEFTLSACEPTKTVNIPLGKGEYYPPRSYRYEDCRWKDESVSGWFIETITAGLFVGNGNYECVQRNGLYSQVGIGHNSRNNPDAMFELPVNLDKMTAFYPKIIDNSSKQRVRVVLNTEGRKQPFWIDRYEVTQASYFALTGELPAANIGIASRPVENLNWYEAILYCNKRSLEEGLNPVYTYTSATYQKNGDWNICINLVGLQQDTRKNGYRLLTVDEWNQAYKAGTNTVYYWGDILNPDVDKYCWYTGNSANMTHPVGGKLPNAWGLYDMAGNVEEWVWTTSPLDPNSRRTMGASYYNEATKMNGNLASNPPTTTKKHIGFRVMRRATDLTPILNLLLQ